MMKKIHAALLSFGMSGRVFHAPFIDVHPGFVLSGSWERSKKEIQKHYPEATSYDSLESVLHDETVDLVVVNTPTYTHYEYTKLALEAGKDVVVEKAFTTTVAEAEELAALAKLKKRKLSVFQNRRWDSDFKTVQSVIDSGVLGRLVEVSFSYDRFSPKLSLKGHKEKQGPGAGIVKDLGPHLIDQALCQFGFPQSVFASIAITREDSLVDDFFEILLYYPQMLVRLRASYFVKEPVPSFIVYGTQGAFLKARADVQEADLQASKRPGHDGWGTEPKEAFGILNYELEGKDVRKEVPALQGDYRQYYEGIYQALTQDAEVPVSAEDGIRVMKIIEAAFLSASEKRVISLA
ncbi:Gfo/Idh/MocA family oxidoreductase [Reichenbachiella carrageenanivorans]|uniref:Gfo/Idh/MocA family oxidoreductase n=1 Tax=Reichenbachiella carrageenanivorans TaxID=2979869 RepID=A0ABY6CX49_9BACT|nr:Gfo/Idh/MocA family oxidoreductase [Reichenbachiella carrageenanivorans]UXX78443.1 Gfo/Idh/MocA family oxidoreductase [Reichenbachiella carrageenanivorans]